MKIDNTPAVNSRNRKPLARVRLRTQATKCIEGIGARAKSKRAARVLQAGDGTENHPILPRTKKNALLKASVILPKFKKRQKNKTWLPTHVWHAKRATMSPPKAPLWRFSLPLTPIEKSYRCTHRARHMRGCVAWDMSYVSTIGLEGVEGSLLGVLKGIGVEESNLAMRKEERWRKGTRSLECWARERDGDQCYISPIAVIWRVHGKSTSDVGSNPSEGKKKTKRCVWIRVHPSSFLQLWNEILKIAKMQRPPVSVEDLRFEIGSIEVEGPGAAEALVGVLQPFGSKEGDPLAAKDPAAVWKALAPVTNSNILPINALLGFDIVDPRLHHPPRTVSKPSSPSADADLLELLSSWPVDDTQMHASVFDRQARLTASKTLPSQKSINRRKGEGLPGSYPDILPSDPRIPVLVFTSCPDRSTGGQGLWTVLLPWKCVLPVWYSLMYYPLSSGGNPRFGGLDEKRQLFFEQGLPWFPGDYPGTKAGWEWETIECERRKSEWTKKPKGKRTEWEHVELGTGKKGELGLGWACDWEFLFNLDSENSVSKSNEHKTIPSAVNDPPLCSPLFHHWPSIKSLPRPISTHSKPLITVTIKLVNRGVPTTCARIYRLPTTPAAAQEWRQLATPQPKTVRLRQHDRAYHVQGDKLPLYEKRAALATALLKPRSVDENAQPTPNDPNYPVVPSEEDLIGFVTTGNFNLGQGKATGLGCIAIARVTQLGVAHRQDVGVSEGLCVVREAGSRVGRLAKWKVV